MKKNILKVAMMVALAAPVGLNLASCGGDGESGSSSSTYSVLDNSYNCAEEAKKNPKVQVLNFWHAFNNVNESAARMINNEFNKLQLTDKKNENPICVEMTSYKDYNSLQDQVKAAISAGSTSFPALVSSYPDHVATYNDQGVVVDMDKFQQDNDLKITDFEDFLESYKVESYNYTLNKAALDKYNASLEQEGAKYGKGQLFSLPVNKSTEVMYYNKTFFDLFTTAKGDLTKVKTSSGTDATNLTGSKRFSELVASDELGIITVTYKDVTYTGKPWDLKNEDGTKTLSLSNPSDIDPTDVSTWLTWEDIEKNGLIIQQISKNYVDPFSGDLYTDLVLAGDEHKNQIAARGSFSISWDSAANFFITVANSFDKYTSISESNGKLKANLLFNDPEVVTQFDTFRNLYKKGIFIIPALLGNKASKYGTDAFVKQQTVMSVGSTAGAALNSAGLFEVGVTAVPVISRENPKVISQGTNVTMLSPKAYIDVTKNEKDTIKQKYYQKQKATWEYVKFITSYESNLTFATNTTYFPTRASVLNSDKYKQHLATKKNNPALKAEAVAMEAGLGMSTTGAMFTDRPFPGSSAIRGDIDTDKILTSILTSTDPVQSVISGFYSTQNAALKEF